MTALWFVSFQCIFRVDFFLGLTGLISLQPRDSQERSPALQFKSLNSLVLSFFISLLYGSSPFMGSMKRSLEIEVFISLYVAHTDEILRVLLTKSIYMISKSSLLEPKDWYQMNTT